MLLCISAIIMSIVILYFVLSSPSLIKPDTTEYIAELLEESTDAVFIIDTNMVIRTWNRAAEKMYGFTRQEAIGLKAHELLRSSLSSNERAGMLQHSEATGNYRTHATLFHKNGSPIHLLNSFSPLRDIKDKLTGYILFHHDFTKAKNAEQQMRETEERFKLLVESVKDYAIFFIDPEGYILTWNAGAKNIKGYNAEEIIGKHISVFYTPEEIIEKEPMLNLQEAAKKGRFEREGWRLRKDGSRFWANIVFSSLYFDDGRLRGFIKITRDITERREAEVKIKKFNVELEKRVREQTVEMTEIFERITDAFIALDKDFRYIYVNKKTGELIHQDPASLIGKCVWDVFPDVVDSDTYKFFQEAMKEQRYICNTDYYAPLDLWQENHIYPSPKGLSIFIRDVTHRKKAEEEILQTTGQLRRLSAYLQTIREDEKTNIAREVHDHLGQTLTALKMDISWLKKKLEKSEPAVIKKLDDSSILLGETINSVRRIVTGLHPGILDTLGIIAALEWLSKDFEERYGIKIFFQEPKEDIKISPEISIGLFRIYQESLTNIARHAGATEVITSIKKTERNLQMIVSDNGSGFDIQKASIKKSLGLISMRERALMMNGSCEIISQPGKGTSIIVKITI